MEVRDRSSGSTLRRSAARRIALLAAALGLGGGFLVTSTAVAAGLPAATPFDHPAGIAFHGTRLAVADTAQGALREIAPDGTRRTLLSGLVPGAMDRGTTGVAVDGAGDVFVGVSDDGAVLAVAPTGASGVYARGLGAPYGLALASDGTLYVGDAGGNRLLAVTPDHQVRTVAALPASPFGVAVGPDGNIYVALLRTGVVDKVTPAGGVSTYATIPGTPKDAEGLAFDSAGGLFVGAGATGAIVRVAPGGGSTAPISAGLAGPLNLAFAPDGSNVLYVAAQGEGAAATTNRIATLGVGHHGLALAHPLIGLTFLPVAPPHAAVYLPGGTGIDPTPYLDVLPQPFIADTGYNAGEPKIAVTHSGDVYMDDISFTGSPCDPGGVGGFPHSRLFQSTDGGRTFHDATPKLNSPCSLDPYLYYDRTASTLFDGDLIGQCSDFQATTDDARSFASRPVCGIAPLDDHETIGAGPPPPGMTTSAGYPNAIYYCWQTVTWLGCNRSLDGLRTFQVVPALAYVTGDECSGPGTLLGQQNGFQTGHVVVGPDGSVYLPKANCIKGPMVTISRNGGASWTEVYIHKEKQTPDHEASVAIDAAGTLYYDWVDSRLLPMMSVSHDRGLHWGPPIQIGPPGLTEADQPALIAGAAGRVAAYFYGTTGDCCYGRSDTNKPAQDVNNVTSPWSAYAVISLDASSPSPTFISTPMNDPRVPMTRGNCGPGRCSNSFDYWDAYIDDGGRLWTSITNECRSTKAPSGCGTPGLTTVSDGVAEGFAGQLLCGPRLDGPGALTAPSWATQALCRRSAPPPPTATPTPPPPVTSTPTPAPIPGLVNTASATSQAPAAGVVAALLGGAALARRRRARRRGGPRRAGRREG